MTVYADVLVALNILLTYILIVASRVLCKRATNKWAVALSSFLGGISALVIFYENGGVAFSVMYKLITGIIVVGVAFLPKSPKELFKELLAFFGVSFLFGGAVYAMEVTFHPQNMIFCNGTVYFDMSISYLVGCVLSVYGVFLLADYLINRHINKDMKCELEVLFRETAVSMPAIVDTGNSLKDSMTGRPVIVAHLNSLAPLFSVEELRFFKNGGYDRVPEGLKKSIRLIPCSGITGETLLKAFVPSEVKIKTDNTSFFSSFCTVAVTDTRLSDGEYEALIHNDILKNGREE